MKPTKVKKNNGRNLLETVLKNEPLDFETSQNFKQEIELEL